MAHDPSLEKSPRFKHFGSFCISLIHLIYVFEYIFKYLNKIMILYLFRNMEAVSWFQNHTFGTGRVICLDAIVNCIQYQHINNSDVKSGNSSRLRSPLRNSRPSLLPQHSSVLPGHHQRHELDYFLPVHQSWRNQLRHRLRTVHRL